jgi:hypothetical protein
MKKFETKISPLQSQIMALKRQDQDTSKIVIDNNVLEQVKLCSHFLDVKFHTKRKRA